MNELQMQLKWVAIKAGVQCAVDHGWEHTYNYRDDDGVHHGTQSLPGTNGSFTDADVAVVLGWLLDAEFNVSFIQDEDTELHDLLIHRLGEYTSIVNVPLHPNLNEALVAAVLALPVDMRPE